MGELSFDTAHRVEVKTLRSSKLVLPTRSKILLSPASIMALISSMDSFLPAAPRNNVTNRVCQHC